MLEEITYFCDKHGLDVPDMDNQYLVARRSKRGARKVTNLHYYRVEVFYTKYNARHVNSRAEPSVE